MIMRCWLLLLMLLAWDTGVARAEPEREFFEKKIRPVLAEHCYACHSQQATKLKGGLRLDTREGLRRGGDSGPAIVPGDSKASLLLKALRQDELTMPPKGPLPPAVVADFARWIDAGAFDPRDGAAAVAPAGASQKDKLWSLQPVRRPDVPSVRDARWPHNNIDRFVRARLERERLEPSDDADPASLCRRLHFVLTGLPPTPEQIDDFLQAVRRDPQAALASAVDRLLASPHFGEHWARHWMDLVCYAETHGVEHDVYIPNMWRYRDYLIRAFNADVPYDRLLREHLAGDLLAPRWNRELGINEAPIGTAFYRFVELYSTPVDPKNEENNVAEMQIDTIGKTFQGLTLACARCHDHKFDPITARDYHAIYGILASSRVNMHVLDAPERLHALDAELRTAKERVRGELVKVWRDELARWPERFADEPWRKAIAAAAGDPAHVLYPMSQAFTPGAWRADQQRRRDFNRTAFRWFADAATDSWRGWHAQGALAHASAAGDFALQPTGPALLTGIYPRGRYSYLVSDRHPGGLRSPGFTLDMKYISVLACGTNDARARLIVENFQGDGLLFAPVMPKLKGGELRWVTLPIRTQHWAGRRAYLELVPRDDMTYAGEVPNVAKYLSDGRSGVGVRAVVFHDQPKPPERFSPFSEDFGAGDVPPAVSFVNAVASAVDAWGEGRASDPQAALLDALVRLGLLPHQLSEQLGAVVAEHRRLEERVPVPQRVVGVKDEEGFDVPLYARGDHRLAKDPVPRRYLEVLGGRPYTLSRTQSGRLELADALASPHNPLTARVMVNRLWHHVFGAGLVRSVDNFGHQGETPSHPELLDYLATELVARDWSLRALIREMVLSRTFGLASNTTAAVHARDPDNRLWAHALVRRLEAESIRDAILQASGRLDRTLFGIGVPVTAASSHDYVITPGPLDGAGRRSIYLEVRRNFPATFLTIFDWPRPLATTGRRNVTNVPAQSLALLNDPFVVQQAELFARRALATPQPAAAERIAYMYLLALGRPPSSAEAERALALVQSDRAEYWRDLAHGLFNLKEFVFLR
jgi:hypothetical protein